MITIELESYWQEAVYDALTSIGFVKDTDLGDNTEWYYYYEAAGKRCAWLMYSTYGNNPSFTASFELVPSLSSFTITTIGPNKFKICYEPLKNGGIAIGFSKDASTPLQVMYVAPNSQDDDWLFAVRHATYRWVVDFGTSSCKQYGADSLYQNLGFYSNDVQILALYNGNRFYDNLFITVLEPYLAWGGSAKAQIGNKTYLLIHMVGDSDHNYYAVEVDG